MIGSELISRWDIESNSGIDRGHSVREVRVWEGGNRLFIERGVEGWDVEGN